MRHHPERGDARAFAEPIARVHERRGIESEPIHAGVELQPDGEAMRAGELLQRRELLEGMHHDLAVFVCRQGKLLDTEDAFE